MGLVRMYRLCGSKQTRNLNKEPELATVRALCYWVPTLAGAVTSGWSLSHHAYPQYARHSCGTTVMRRWVRLPEWCQTGIWRGNRQRTTRLISASTGE